MSMEIPIVLLEDYLSYGLEMYYMWEPDKVPHAAVIGGTGSGKTYFCKILLGKICKYAPDTEIIVADFKGDDDFIFLNVLDNFYRFTECYKGVDNFYNRFLERQKGNDTSRTPLFLYFDELAAAVNFLPKRDAEEFKSKISTLLMLGRSFRCFLIFALQRPDAAFLPARDNINLVISLGNTSPESREMFFHSFKDEMLPDRKQGTGYMLESGANLSKIIVPSITDMDKLHNTIISGMQKYTQRSETELCDEYDQS